MKSFASFLIAALLPLSAITQSAKWSCTVPDGYTYDQVVKVAAQTPTTTFSSRKTISGPASRSWALFTIASIPPHNVQPLGPRQSNTVCGNPVDGLMSCGPGTWNGFVFDFMVPTTLCTLTGEAQGYHLRAPVDNLWSCNQLIGFVYDKVESVGLCAVGGAMAPMYHLRKPVDGLWACGPGTYNNFTYDEILAGAGISGSTCVLGNVAAPSYHLRKPQASVWVCDVPSGWHYSQTRAATDCLVGQQSTQYLLQ